jgi:hypothetical protein
MHFPAFAIFPSFACLRFAIRQCRFFGTVHFRCCLRGWVSVMAPIVFARTQNIVVCVGVGRGRQPIRLAATGTALSAG